MWAKYKFYVIAAGVIVLGFILYKAMSKKTDTVEQAASDPASKLVNTGANTVNDQVAMMRALNYVR